MNAVDYPHGRLHSHDAIDSTSRSRPKRQTQRPKRLIEETNAPISAPKRRKAVLERQTLGHLNEQFSCFQRMIDQNSALLQSSEFVKARSMQGAQTGAGIAYTVASHAVTTCSREVERRMAD